MSKTSAEVSELTPLLLETEVGVIGGLQRMKAAPEEVGNAPLTLVLHSAGGGARSLAKLAQQLQIPGHLVVPDLNSYGHTKLAINAAGSFNAVEKHLQIISALIDQLRQPRQDVYLIGQSMGGFLCLKTAFTKRYPVKALVVIEPVAFSVLDPVVDAEARAEDLEKVLALDSVLKASGNPEIALGNFIAYWGQADWKSLPSKMREALLSNVEQISAETLAIAQDNTSTAHYQSLQLPVLLMQGSMTQRPAVAVVKRMADLLTHAEVNVIDGAGHMGAVQQPLDFSVPINRFLKQHI